MVMFKKGDTLIEVMLAIGIFSMIAIAITAVMTSGSSGAQTTLETTLAREEIDAQAEAIRFIQTSYAINKSSADKTYANLWNEIKERAIVFQPGATKETKEATLQYTPETCDAALTQAGNHAFVINPRALSEFSSSGASDAIVTGNRLTTTQTYPRLVFGGSSGENGSNDLLVNSGDQLYRAEGIYVIAVKDDGTTDVIDASGDVKDYGFYDFFIRSCWYGANDDQPTTISTVIRLYDPDAITKAGLVKVTYVNPYIAPGSPTPPGGTKFTPTDYDFASPKGGSKVTLPKVEPRNGWEFHWEIISSTPASGDCVKTGYFDSGAAVTNDCPSTISYTLQGKWKHIHYDIAYDTSPSTYPEGYAISESETVKFSPQTCFSDNHYDDGRPKTDGCTLHGRINGEGRKLSASGYKVVGWCNARPEWDNTNKKHRCSRDFFAVSGNTTTGPNINQGPNPNFPNYFGPESNGVRNMTLYPVWETNNETYAIQLSWNAPVDYEANLFGYKSNGASFTAYYGSQINNDLDGTNIATLNHDCTASKAGCVNNWNETFILNTYGARSYYYYVCRYSPGTCGGTVDRSSNLTVKVYIKDSTGDTSLTIVESGTKDSRTYNALKAYNDYRWKLVKTYNISSASGSSGHIWNVFAYKDGEIYDKNTITDAADTSY